MKKQFLDELDKLLFALNEEERGEILYFYKERIENGVFEGKSEEQVIASLEKPSIIAKNIYKEYGINYEAFFTEKVEQKIEKISENVETSNPYEYKYERTERDDFFDKLHGAITGSSVFIALGIFLWFGFAYNMWHPMWLIFIIIPLSATLVETFRNVQALPGAMVFISTIAFFITGFNGHWGLGTIWFITIPLSGAIISPFTPSWIKENNDKDKEYFKNAIEKELTKQEKINIESVKIEKNKDESKEANAKKIFTIIGVIFFDLVFVIGILGGLFGFAIGALSSLSIVVAPVWIIINSPYLSFIEAVTFTSLWAYAFIFVIFLSFLAVELFIFVFKWVVILHARVFGAENTLVINNIKKWSIIRKTKRSKHGSFRKNRASFKLVTFLSIIGIIVPIIFTPVLIFGDTFVNRYIDDKYLLDDSITITNDDINEINVSHFNGSIIVIVDTNIEYVKFDHYYDFELRKDVKYVEEGNKLSVSNVDNDGFIKYISSHARREKLVITVPSKERYKISIEEKTVHRICLPDIGCRWTFN